MGHYYSNSCDHVRDFLWTENWERVEIELSVDSIRPDISLITSDRVTHAIEVLVTHALDSDKISQLLELEIQFIEVDVNHDGNISSNGNDIYIIAKHPYLWPAYRCDECSKVNLKEIVAYYAERGSGHSLEDLQLGFKDLHTITNAPNWDFKPLKKRAVDFYYPNGDSQRKIFSICRINKDNLFAYILYEETSEIPIVFITRIPKIEDETTVFKLIHQDFKNHLKKRIGIYQGGFIDSPYSWADENLFIAGFSNFTYIWDSSKWIQKHEKPPA
jgi:hypothetical protein